jgi:SpoVK/Ycf46/Vps4 family AAA+-type ATPase
MVRNGLVSVFLRKLEYCEGIMFFTTNRVAEFDEAILSRIHLMLKYDGLSEDARKQIWGHFLNRAKTSQGVVEISEKELVKLTESKLNGRQVRVLLNVSRVPFC